MERIVYARTEAELCQAVVLYCKENNIQRNSQLHYLLHRVALELWGKLHRTYTAPCSLLQFRQNKFDLVVADPPWPNNTKWVLSPYGSYPRMSIGAISALPVSEVVNERALLLVWTCSMYLQETINIIQQWGFRFNGWAFIWLKLQNGKPRGSYTNTWYPCKACEIVLMGIRGKPPKSVKYILDIIVAERRAHSQKPQEFWDKLSEWLGDDQYENKLDMFSREKREGWTVWGN